MGVSNEGLREFLLGSGGVPRRTLDELVGQGSLAELLVAQGYLSPDELRRAEAHLLGVPFVELMAHEIDHEALFLIPEPLARARSVVAYRAGPGRVEVALLNVDDLEHLNFLLTQGTKVVPHLTTAESIKRALILYQKKLKERFGTLAKGGVGAAEALVRHALLSHASHVHLDLKTFGLLVRYRIEGLMHDAMNLPRESVELVARLKEMAGLSPTLHVPQEGAFKLERDGEGGVRVRVHSSPTDKGERIVLNLFPSGITRNGFTLESLGLHGESLENAHTLLNARSGLIVVEGKAHSGKTTLLYTLADLLSNKHTHVVTVESDVEVALPHATQLKVRPDVGLTVAATLRAALKQDSDVVVVSEVHEREEAELIISAAARGVLVVAGADTLELFKKDEKNLKGVIHTRLVRRVCPHCHEMYRLSRAEGAPFEGHANFGRALAALKEEGVVAEDMQWKDLQLARAGQGCKECEGGYKGSVGLQEVSVRGETPLNLIEDGLFKAVQGVVSVEDVKNSLI